MKLHIKSNEGYNIRLWLPTCLLKSKLIYKALLKTGGNSLLPLIDLLPKYYNHLRKYIKNNGHFVLVDIISADGDNVKIKL